MIKGLDHVTIIVKDLEAAVAQYEKILGRARRAPTPEPATPRRDPGYKANVISFGTTNIELVTPTNDYGPHARRLLANGDGVYLVALKVDNLRETVDELRSKGVRLVDDPGPGTEPITSLVCVHPRSANGVMILLLER